MHIEGLMHYVNEEYKERLRTLIALKATVGETYLHKSDRNLNEWILSLFRYIEAEKENLATNNANMELLNDFYLKMLYAKTNY